MNILSMILNQRWKHHFSVFLSLGIAFLLVPQHVFGAVFISEIAWMGTDVSANDEWIELATTDSTETVDLTGWTLTASDGSPVINLAGSISGGYFLLERTDDDSVPGITADYIFSGALGNTGEQLTLTNSQGVVIDQVNMADGWIGGDNTTKDTIQKSGNSWVTAPGTPRTTNATNSSFPTNTSESSNTDTHTSSHTGGNEISTQSKVRKKHIELYAGRDRIALVGQPIEFVAELVDGSSYITGAEFRWNFGDGTIDMGHKSPHTYLFPGRYVVVLNASHENIDYTARTTVTVFEPDIAIVESGPGFVVLENMSSQEANLTGWTVLYEDRTFYIPKDTIILPGALLPVRHPFESGEVEVMRALAETIEVQDTIKNVAAYDETMNRVSEGLHDLSVTLARIEYLQHPTYLYTKHDIKPEQEEFVAQEEAILTETEANQVSHNDTAAAVVLYDESEHSEQADGWIRKIGSFLKNIFN